MNMKLAKGQVGKMASWQNGKVAKWQIGKMASWQSGKMASWQDTKLTKHTSTHTDCFWILLIANFDPHLMVFETDFLKWCHDILPNGKTPNDNWAKRQWIGMF
jgi:hypothetical protein